MSKVLDINSLLLEVRNAVQIYIDLLLISKDDDDRLKKAIKYSSTNIGKAMRAFLVIESSKMFGVDTAKSMPIAASVELIHTYSLIHDDLPAMDNDSIRRGKPTCHKMYGEAAAILAGDSLLTLAFELLSSELIDFSSNTKLTVINTLAKAIGMNGMAGGQMLDILFEGQELAVENIMEMQKKKTAYFIAACCKIGGILGNVDKQSLSYLENYGMALGTAFQITDDILDIEGCEIKAGKKLRKDYAAGKATLVDKVGLNDSKIKAQELIDLALEEIKNLQCDYSNLSNFAYFIALRNLH
jgi:farnesyl diphosphate synthase